MPSVNLIAVLDGYLVLTFLLSTVMRYRQYQELLGMIFVVPGRWPRLFQLVREHRGLFLTWPTMMPIATTFAVMLLHTIAYHAIWHTAQVTLADIFSRWTALIGFVLFGAGMLWLDFTTIFRIWQIDRAALERSFDQAEYWLRSWVSPAVRMLTFGFVNPRKMVHEEVSKALVNATRDLNTMMWRWTLQIAIRLLFGLTLWLTWWAATRP
jgi:hypothetical protein